MATQNTIPQGARLALTTVSKVLPLLSGDPLSKAAVHLNHLVCAVTCTLSKLVPSMLAATLHPLGSYILAHQQFLLSVQTLRSFSRLLHFISASGLS